MSSDKIATPIGADAGVTVTNPQRTRTGPLTPGQQRWNHFSKMKASSLMLVRPRQESVSTIREGDEDDNFDEEFDAPNGPNRMMSFSLTPSDHDGETSVSRDLNASDCDDVTMADDSRYEAAPPSSSIPPIERSVDLLPTMYSSNQPSNVFTDEASIYSQATEHSMATIPMANRRRRTDASVMTTSTMATEAVGNTNANRTHHQSQQQQQQPQPQQQQPSDCTRASSLVGTSQNSSSDNNAVDPESLRRPSSMTRSGATGHRGPPTNMGRVLINDQGHTMSDQEMQLIWEAAGKCVKCGITSTHTKQKYGPFGTLRRMVPVTEPGRSYKGYCLQCHDVPQLRRLLNEPNIPFDLSRDDPNPNVSLRALELLQEGADHTEILLSRKQSAVAIICASIKFQICCGCILLLLAGAVVVVGISMAKRPETWVSLAPTDAPTMSPTTSSPSMSPTVWDWTLSSEIRSNTESFGYDIELSSDGVVLAIASPNYDGGKGRFDVYSMAEVANEQRWIRIEFDSGTPETGSSSTDHMGHALSLSGDGTTVAVGSPGRGDGTVHVYNINLDTLRISVKGQPLVGPATISEFGYSAALNKDGSILFVGAPNYEVESSEIYGLVRSYRYDATADMWEPFGGDMSGQTPGCRFGHATTTIDNGNLVIVGAPLESTKWKEGGEVSFFHLDEATSPSTWERFQNTQVTGAAGAQMGLRVATTATNERGTMVITNNAADADVPYPEAGAVEIWGVDFDNLQTNIIGVPIPGSHANAGFGYDMDFAKEGEILIASGKNFDKKVGDVRVFAYRVSDYLPLGDKLSDLEIGECQYYGGGPSVAIAATVFRLAVGYECIMMNGISRSVVRVFDFLTID